MFFLDNFYNIFLKVYLRFLFFESMRYFDIIYNILCFFEYLRIVCMYKCYYLGWFEFFFLFEFFIFNFNFSCINVELYMILLYVVRVI